MLTMVAAVALGYLVMAVNMSLFIVLTFGFVMASLVWGLLLLVDIKKRLITIDPSTYELYQLNEKNKSE